MARPARPHREPRPGGCICRDDHGPRAARRSGALFATLVVLLNLSLSRASAARERAEQLAPPGTDTEVNREGAASGRETPPQKKKKRKQQRSKRARLVEAMAAETGTPLAEANTATKTQTPAELNQEETAVSAGYHEARTWDDAARPKTQQRALHQSAPPRAGFDRENLGQAYHLTYLAPDPAAIRLQIHGEYQARFATLTDLPLLAAPGIAGARSFDSLGQTSRLYHWLRLRPRFDWFDRFSIVAELDAPYGLFYGQKTRDVGAATEPLDDVQPVRADPRWLYGEWRHPWITVTVGQRPFHVGMGLLGNDGNHASPFGDYQRGDRKIGVAVLVKPLGPHSNFSLEGAGDLIFQDPTADLRDGDRALEGMLRSTHSSMLGTTSRGSAYRSEFTLLYRRATQISLSDFGEELFTFDVAGAVRAEAPGARGHIFAEYELVYRAGSLTLPFTAIKERITAFGGAVRLGVALDSTGAARSFERWVALLESGFASADAEPADRLRSALTFHPNHNVGLLLFDEALAWKTARSATLLAERTGFSPANAERATDGGVRGAAYVHPLVMFRPVEQLRLSSGAVLGQATGDVVDHGAVDPRLPRNYDGGSSQSRDLGLELDLGVDYRLLLEHRTALELGVQAGILFPGRAFDDARGGALPVQSIVILRSGTQF